ncbi:MAG: DUF971 domain-containing protein [Calditrichaeota bacterium]|nr:MAG: DUF971 domain-containing protein [Calditrichota bacterium]
MLPTDIRKSGENELIIVWDDGHESHYQMQRLRKACPCATCKTAREKARSGPLNVLSPQEVIPENVQVRSAEIIGRYAVQFAWSDGHHEGIYSFDYLLSLCECVRCSP